MIDTVRSSQKRQHYGENEYLNTFTVQRHTFWKNEHLNTSLTRVFAPWFSCCYRKGTQYELLVLFGLEEPLKVRWRLRVQWFASDGVTGAAGDAVSYDAVNPGYGRHFSDWIRPRPNRALIWRWLTWPNELSRSAILVDSQLFVQCPRYSSRFRLLPQKRIINARDTTMTWLLRIHSELFVSFWV